MTKIKTKSFEKWTQQELMKTFNLNKLNQLPVLEAWLTLTLPPELALTPAEREFLTKKQFEAIEFIETWSEQELIIRYIAHILEFAHLSQRDYQPFAQRQLKAKVGDYYLSGMVDLMIASGHFEPESPYFCFHEYKRTHTGHDSDPVGQLLATMLAAQAINQDINQLQPIYGVYVIGRLWYFAVLLKSEYAISLPFDSTKAELWDIMRLLAGLNVLFASRKLTMND